MIVILSKSKYVPQILYLSTFTLYLSWRYCIGQVNRYTPQPKDACKKLSYADIFSCVRDNISSLVTDIAPIHIQFFCYMQALNFVNLQSGYTEFNIIPKHIKKP